MSDLTTSRPLHELTLGDVSRNNARRFRDRIALVDGDERWTFAALDERAARAAGALHARGVGRGDAVAWVAPNSAWFVAVLLGAARLGAAVAPLSWRLTEAERTPILNELDPAVVIDEPARAEELGTGDPIDDDDPAVSEDDPALVIFTAAFGGRPLGAQLTHRNLLTQALLLAARDDLDGHDVYLASGPFAHIGALQYVLAHWLVGGRVVVVPKLEPTQAVALIEQERVTGAFIMPASVPDLVRAAEAGNHDLRSLRTPALAGDPMLERWTAMTSRPRGAGAIGTSTGYGQTEVTGLVTSVALGLARARGSGGWPQHAAVVRVVRPGTLEEAAPGEIGEIVVRGPLVMAGYRDADMGDRWAGGWHRTTDLGRYEDDGSIAFLGPAGNLVKTGGENVYPAEVEAVLREHPEITEACVVGVDDARWGQVVAAMVATDREALEVSALDAWCRERLAGFKRPRRWAVVAELPRRADGRVDRDAVIERLAQGS